MAQHWTCDPCQRGDHIECWYSSLLGPYTMQAELICDCPCEPIPLPGFPDARAPIGNYD